MSDVCPHCNHGWDLHNKYIGGKKRCEDCGCMWCLPDPGPVVTPPTERDLAIERVRLAIYAELNRQMEADEIDAAGYWDDEWGRLDGEPDWGKVAEAALNAAQEDE